MLTWLTCSFGLIPIVWVRNFRRHSMSAALDPWRWFLWCPHLISFGHLRLTSLCLLISDAASSATGSIRRKNSNFSPKHMGISINGGTPKWILYFMENPIEMDDLRVASPILGNLQMGTVCQTFPGIWGLSAQSVDPGYGTVYFHSWFCPSVIVRSL